MLLVVAAAQAGAASSSSSSSSDVAKMPKGSGSGLLLRCSAAFMGGTATQPGVRVSAKHNAGALDEAAGAGGSMRGRAAGNVVTSHSADATLGLGLSIQHLGNRWTAFGFRLYLVLVVLLPHRYRQSGQPACLPAGQRRNAIFSQTPHRNCASDCSISPILYSYAVTAEALELWRTDTFEEHPSQAVTIHGNVHGAVRKLAYIHCISQSMLLPVADF
jgi:hypothetical protein